MDFSSWPRDQEATFVVYEQRTAESQRKAILVGIVSAVAVLVVAVGIYAAVPPDIKEVKGMNMSNLTKKAKTEAPAPAPAPAAAPAPAPAADKPADPPAADKK